VAAAIADAPDAARLDALRADPASPSVAGDSASALGRDPAVDRDTENDEAERRAEMLEGLAQLVALAEGAALPILATQHRVIGTDACHLTAPASLAAGPGGIDAPGKLFVTSHRLIFAAGTVTAWPWHRVRRINRAGYDLLIEIAGRPEPVRLRCNTYGDALCVCYLATRLLT
jgi:hypothetical protein